MEQKNIVYTAENQERDINLRHYLGVVLKRRWLMLLITILAVAVAGLYCYIATPLYQARSSLYMNSNSYSFLPDVINSGVNIGRDETFFNTQYKILMSKSLATRIVKRLDLRSEDFAPPKKGVKPAPAVKKPLTEEMISGIAGTALGVVKIEPIRDTNLCEIVVTTADPKLSEKVANAWAEEYVEYSLAAEYENTQKARAVLDEQIITVRQGMADKEKALREYSLKREVVKLENQRSMSSQNLEELNVDLNDAKQNATAKEIEYNQIRAQNPSSVAAVMSSQSVQQLKTEYSRLEQQYAEKGKTYKADYPEMVRIRSQMDLLKKKIDQEINQVFQQTVGAAHTSHVEAQNKERALRSQLESMKRQVVEQKDKESSYDALVQEIDQKKSLIEYLLQKRNEAGVSDPVNEKKATMIRIVDRAELPKGIYSPNVIKTVLFAFLIGIGMSVAAVFLLEFLDRSFKTTEEVERYTHLPTLGVIPLHFMNEGNGNHPQEKALVKSGSSSRGDHSIDLLSLYAPTSLAAEAIRTVRTGLLMSFPERPPHSILVTSSKAGEGKTFVSCNLALSLTQLDKKVLLIDADLRNPQLHRIWGIKNEKGLSRFLTSEDGIFDGIIPLPVTGLSLIPSGVRSPRPAELLASSKFQQLLQSLREHFDHIIIDSPPLLPVADSMIIAGKCDCVVMVVRGGSTPRDFVQLATQQLGKAEATIAGAILNGINLTDPYYYSYYYSYRYYGEQPKLTS